MTPRRLGEVVLTRAGSKGPFVPLGVPGAYKTYRMSETSDLEDDLARIAPFIASFEGAARSRPNRPTRHRLIELVEAAEEDLRAMRAGGRGRHLMDVVELGQIVPLLSQWKEDRAGAEIVNDLKDPGVYAHSILVLAIARSLRMWRNEVRLVRRQPTRAPDVVVLTEHGDVAVEVKAPREFDGRDWVRQRDPRRVAADAFRRSSSQRRTANASILVVAGYRIPDLIRSVFADEIGTQFVGRPQVAAALILSMGAHVDDQAEAAAAVADQAPIGRTLTREETRAVLSLPITTSVLHNSHYRGAVNVVGLDDPARGLRLPTRAMIVRASPPMPRP